MSITHMSSDDFLYHLTNLQHWLHTIDVMETLEQQVVNNPEDIEQAKHIGTRLSHKLDAYVELETAFKLFRKHEDWIRREASNYDHAHGHHGSYSNKVARMIRNIHRATRKFCPGGLFKTGGLAHTQKLIIDALLNGDIKTFLKEHRMKMNIYEVTEPQMRKALRVEKKIDHEMGHDEERIEIQRKVRRKLSMPSLRVAVAGILVALGIGAGLANAQPSLNAPDRVSSQQLESIQKDSVKKLDKLNKKISKSKNPIDEIQSEINILRGWHYHISQTKNLTEIQQFQLSEIQKSIDRMQETFDAVKSQNMSKKDIQFFKDYTVKIQKYFSRIKA